MKILVLVLAKDTSPWKEIEELGQNLTWKKTQSDVEIIRYVGQENVPTLGLKIAEMYWKLRHQIITLRITKILKTNSYITKYMNRYLSNINLSASQKSDVISVDLPDRYFLIGLKTIAAFRFALENLEFDYIYRTNISSYVNIERLIQFGERLPSGDVYSGPFAKHDEIKFASGSGYFLSKSLVRKVVDESSFWNHAEIDDVALGQLISRLGGIKFVDARRIDFDTPADVFKLSQEEFDSVFHYRCKHEDWNKTIQIMKNIHFRNLDK